MNGEESQKHLEDKEIFNVKFTQISPFISEFTFTNLWMWRDYYQFTWKQLDDTSIVLLSLQDPSKEIVFPVIGNDYDRVIPELARLKARLEEIIADRLVEMLTLQTITFSFASSIDLLTHIILFRMDIVPISKINKRMNKMANNKGAVIFLAIIAVAGLGLSGYMFTMDLLSRNEDADEGLKLVALWDRLDKNTENNPLYSTNDNFLLEYYEQVVVDTNYVNVINETRFTLSILGLYKINLNVLLDQLTTAETYWIKLLRNNTVTDYFEYVRTANPIVHTYHYSRTNVYINNTSGYDYYEINAYGLANFGVYSSSSYNQLSIEYVHT